MTEGIYALLDRARERYERLTPEQAYRATVSDPDGTVIVDIRPAAQRAEHGEVPGALVIERNVLEWRLDPTSDARLPIAGSHDTRYVVLCQQGYASSLAAVTLIDIGLHRATDVVGGFDAWQRCGLPTLRWSG